MKVDNEEIWKTFDEHARYCRNLHSIAQFMYCNNKRIVEAENKLARRVNEGKIRETSELKRERAWHAEVKRNIIAREIVPIVNEVNDVKTKLFLLRENEKTNEKNENENDLLREVIVMH